jgi:hypothetical protein
MTYQAFINHILQTRGRFMCGNEYHERHHITPRCKNGSNDEENLIDLFAREHFIAHKLLAEENSDDDQLVSAYIIMAFTKDKNQQRYELTPGEYEEARKMHAKRFSGGNNPSARPVIRLCDEKVYCTINDCCLDNNSNTTTMWSMLKQHRNFMYYDEWMDMTDDERQNIKMVDWASIQHKNRSDAAKRAGNGGSVRCSQSTREKIGLAHVGKYGVTIYCPELDEQFATIKAASDKIGVNKTSIGRCVRGEQKHAGKHPITGEKLQWVKLENKNS